MGDNLPELLYAAWRSERLAFEHDLPSWGNVRDPDVRRAWEAAAVVARTLVDTKQKDEVEMLLGANGAWQREHAALEQQLAVVRIKARDYADLVMQMALDPDNAATAFNVGVQQRQLEDALGIKRGGT